MQRSASGCLVVVDFQNDFVTGSLGTKEAIAIEDAVAEQIRTRRDEGWDIVFTLDTHDDKYLGTKEGKHLPVEHCIKGTEGHALAPKIEAAAEPSDVRMEKGTFGSPELAHMLQEKGYETVELAGLVTDICVMANAILASTALPEAEILVDPALTAGTTPQAKDAALATLRSLQVTMPGEGI